MRRFIWLATTTLMLAVGAPTNAQNAPSADFGNGLYSVCTDDNYFARGECLGYINGAATTLDFSELICLPANVTFGQVRDIVIQGLRDNPSERQRGSGYLTWKYLSAAFPCKKR